MALSPSLLPMSMPTPAQAQTDPIEQLLQSMTLETRVGQLFMVSFFGEGITDTAREFLQTVQPGAFALFRSNGETPDRATQIINDLQQVAVSTGANLPMIMAIDHEGGTVVRLTAGFTALPWGPALGAMPEADSYAVGAMAAQELRAVGITMNLAPVADVRSDPSKKFMEKRSFGTDPQLVGTGVVGYTRGLQDNNVTAVLKHFPGHGAADDSHTVLPTITESKEQLQQIDLVPFEMGIAAGADAVMIGHLVVPAYETVPDWPASLSAIIVTDLLRKQLGFNGVIMTDALDMGAIVNNVAPPEAAVIALQAGVDMVVAGPHMPIGEQLKMRDAVLEALRTGKLPLEQINDSVRRILKLKQKYGLLSWQPLDPRTAVDRIQSAAHSAALDQIYQDTVAIARDQFKLLPLNPAEQRVLLVFPGSFPAIQSECLVLDPRSKGYAYSLNPVQEEIASVRISARDADVVVIFTYNISENPFQRDLVNAIDPQKTVVVALQSPYDIEEGIQPGAYVTVFNAYPPSFKAACNVLYGQHPALGRWTLP
ncbi:MAG: glycoside hydrolase family 3 protein [Anaerolineae bacterium]